MGVLDAFVFAHDYHRRNIDKAGNFGDCMKGRIRFMTAITPVFAHVCQFISLAGHIPGSLHSTRFCVPAAKARYPLLSQRSYHNSRKRF